MRRITVLFVSILVVCCHIFSQENRIRGNEISVLTPYEALYSDGISLFNPHDSLKGYWLENWTETTQSIKWNVLVEKAAAYRVEGLMSVENIGKNDKIEFVLNAGGAECTCDVSTAGWQRVTFHETVYLPEGCLDIVLKIKNRGLSDITVKLHSLEFVTPDVYLLKKQEADAMRADVDWMNDITYGFFFHWNSKSMPMSGEPLSYEDAVNKFDTDRFAQMVNECGGELVIFTTSWAGYYFPAPLETINKILPGRTTRRDLIADLAKSLEKYNIRLMIYYHMGHGDEEWWRQQCFSRTNSKTLFSNLEKIIGEIGERYKDQIAGIWMDDGKIYYHNHVPFERINQAAKRGNKNMAVTFNSWILPRVTDFQDFYAGELGLSLYAAGVDNPYLPVGSNGYFIGGPQKGLKATYTGVFEPGEWTHIYKNKPIDIPMYSLTEIETIIKESKARKNLPIINLRIYQDGTISPYSYEIMRKLKEYCELNKFYCEK